MSDDAESGKATPRAKPSAREAARAEALRANLMRRKTQARERTESTESGDIAEQKPGGDA